MKKLRLWITALVAVVSIGSLLVFAGCQKENGPEDLLDLDMSNISMMTPGQQAIFEEAVERLDEHISFDADAGQFTMEIGVTAGKVGLSQRFFDYFKQNLEVTNAHLKQMQGEGCVAVQICGNRIQVVNPEDDFDIITRAIPEDEFEIGGITHTETTWWGYRAFLSNSDLKNISSAAQLTTILCGAASVGAAPFTVPVGTLTAITAWIADGAADKHPNGVIVNIPQFGAPSYVPQSALPK